MTHCPRCVDFQIGSYESRCYHIVIKYHKLQLPKLIIPKQHIIWHCCCKLLTAISHLRTCLSVLQKCSTLGTFLREPISALSE